jgi:hypothetical protein
MIFFIKDIVKYKHQGKGNHIVENRREIMAHVVFALPSFKDMTEPVSVDLLRRPGIDSQPGGPVPQHTARQATQAGGTILRNRFLGSINVTNTGSGFCGSAVYTDELYTVHSQLWTTPMLSPFPASINWYTHRVG